MKCLIGGYLVVSLYSLEATVDMRGSKVLSWGGGATVTFFFFLFFVFVLVDEGREDPNTTISGPSSARQRNAILMAFRWCAGDGT